MENSSVLKIYVTGRKWHTKDFAKQTCFLWSSAQLKETPLKPKAVP